MGRHCSEEKEKDKKVVMAALGIGAGLEESS
jgi:hypothetical protein